MPWTIYDNQKLRYYLGFSAADSNALQWYMDAITNEVDISQVQSDLTEIGNLETQLSAAATSDFVEELVGDIKFRKEGKAPALLRRRNELLTRISNTLGLAHVLGSGQAPIYRG